MMNDRIIIKYLGNDKKNSNYYLISCEKILARDLYDVLVDMYESDRYKVLH